MDWYYALDRDKVGPLDEEAFRALVADGTVREETLVWNAGLPEWRRWRDVRAAEAMGATAPPLVSVQSDAAPTLECAECGGQFEPAAGVVLRGAFVCAGCKPVYVLRLKQGSPLPGPPATASMGRRFAAKAIDSIFLMVVTYTAGQLVMAIGASIQDTSGAGAALFIGGFAAWSLGSMVLGVAYGAYFVSRFSGTPGKLLLDLRVLTAVGERPGFATAVGRVLGEVVSQMVCYLGYVMAFFDAQRRALHDQMAGTRVVKIHGND